MAGLIIEVLILALIAVEIIFSLVDRKENKERDARTIQLQQDMVRLLGEQKEVLEESNAELADIRDETVEDETAETNPER